LIPSIESRVEGPGDGTEPAWTRAPIDPSDHIATFASSRRLEPPKRSVGSITAELWATEIQVLVGDAVLRITRAGGPAGRRDQPIPTSAERADANNGIRGR
jgi:hypothetical protein